MFHKEWRVLLGLFMIASLLLFQSPAVAQGTSTGSVQGIVTDQSGATVPDAPVVLRNVATGAVLNSQTDASGSFSFPIVAVGRYTLRVNKSGFKSYVQSEFAVNAAAPVKL